jgi:jagged-1
MELNLCNSCIREQNISKCSNLWCGLPNCNSDKIVENQCNEDEVCFFGGRETCLSPPCVTRGDCRKREDSLRTGPPKYPVSSSCWPNQAVLSENCSRISIVLDMFNISRSRGLSAENYCHNLRTIVGGIMIERNFHSPSAIIIICDIKTGTNDTIEVTIVSIN